MTQKVKRHPTFRAYGKIDDASMGIKKIITIPARNVDAGVHGTHHFFRLTVKVFGRNQKPANALMATMIIVMLHPTFKMCCVMGFYDFEKTQ